MGAGWLLTAYTGELSIGICGTAIFLNDLLGISIDILGVAIDQPSAKDIYKDDFSGRNTCLKMTEGSIRVTLDERDNYDIIYRHYDDANGVLNYMKAYWWN